MSEPVSDPNQNTELEEPAKQGFVKRERDKQSAASQQSTSTVHIVIVELQYHNELLQNMYDTLSLLDFKLTFVTLPELMSKTNILTSGDSSKYSAELKRDDESVKTFLKRMTPVFESADILYFNTVRHYWEELNQIPINVPGIVRIHNAHCDLAPLTHFKQPFINVFGILSHLIRKVLIGGEWRLKQQFFAKNGYLMMPNQVITDYVNAHQWGKGFKILPPVLPFAYLAESKNDSETKVEEQQDRIVSIAITGKVTNSKKDFDLVYRALKMSLPQLKCKLKLILLGNARDKHAKSILNNFKSLEGELFELDYSDAYVPQEVFDEKVKNVDFFIAPIKVKTHFRKYREVYGKSKMSGVENDILLHRKPSLVIADYPVSAPLDKVVDYFDSDATSLSNKIIDWIAHNRPAQMKDAFNQMDSFKKEVIAENFYRLCLKLMEESKKQD
ncbi:MAG: hypothetical protein HWE27_18810 [Gammaproteobacteria bacterium]|nr:hypothetical protein [Gammaproteobacteria bacterium]